MDFLTTLTGYLNSVGDWALKELQAIWKWAQKLTTRLHPLFKRIDDFFKGIWGHLKKIWASIRAIKHTDFWKELHKWYGRYNAWVDWYQKHLLGPLQQIQKMIQNLYKVVFAPIIKTIDSVRVMLDTLFFWNKSLAAKIDSALFGLEAKVMTPITYMLKRVNALSSLYTAILTTSGRIDGSIFVDTLSTHLKDIAKIWSGWARGAKPPKLKFKQTTWGEMDLMFRQYQADHTGPLSPIVDQITQGYNDTAVEIGGRLG